MPKPRSGAKFWMDADEVQGNLRTLSNTFPGVHEAAQLKLTKEMYKEAYQRTPKRFGWLRESEKVVGPDRSGTSVTTAISAGDERAWYAMIVHEDLEAFHPIGQAKYIESVLMEYGPYVTSRIGREIDLGRALRGRRS